MKLSTPLKQPTNDSAVRATNTEAVRTKQSISTLHYYHDPYIPYFSASPPSQQKEKQRVDHKDVPVRLSPLINRGTFARVHAVERLTRGFLKCSSGKGRQVVVLGAGDCTLGFRLLLEKGLEEKKEELGGVGGVKWVEFDFEEVVKRKITIVEENLKGEFLELKRYEKVEVGLKGRTRAGGEWSVFGVDLRRLDEVKSLLFDVVGFDKQVPTLFISECVLIYMKPEESDNIIEMLCESFEGVRMFVNYDQIEPYDPFGKQMVSHIARRGCPLLGIDRYPTSGSQQSRFEKLGWTNVKALNMNEYYRNYLEMDVRKRIERIEMLDELEEWTMLMQHYCLLWAITGDMDEGALEKISLRPHD